MALISLQGNAVKHGKDLESFLVATGTACEVYDDNGESNYIARFTCRTSDNFCDILPAMLDNNSLGVEQISSDVVLGELRSFSGFGLEHLVDTYTS